MKIVLRPQAKALGLKYYFTGKPCKYGHISERLLGNGSCYQCELLRNRDWKLNNRSKCTSYEANRRAAKLERTPGWADHDKIAYWHSYAELLTRVFKVKYSVDHVIPLQGEEVSGLHVDYNMQAMVTPLNSAKGNSFSLELQR